jgi:hypothetical protein
MKETASSKTVSLRLFVYVSELRTRPHRLADSDHRYAIKVRIIDRKSTECVCVSYDYDNLRVLEQSNYFRIMLETLGR